MKRLKLQKCNLAETNIDLYPRYKLTAIHKMTPFFNHISNLILFFCWLTMNSCKVSHYRHCKFTSIEFVMNCVCVLTAEGHLGDTYYNTNQHKRCLDDLPGVYMSICFCSGYPSCQTLDRRKQFGALCQDLSTNLWFCTLETTT